MVSEIILCVKEVNQKTRTAAYELLVSLARAMHEQHPPPMPALSQDLNMGELHTSHIPITDSNTVRVLAHARIRVLLDKPRTCCLSSFTLSVRLDVPARRTAGAEVTCSCTW